jgi:predicted nucleic acid-binding protein
MKPKAYVETTVVSYLTARPSRDVVIAGHQQSTRDWWDTCPDNFQLVASELVVQEAGAGDEGAARERLEALESLTLLETAEEALALAQQLVDASAVPQKASEDALHIALAAVNGIEYLVTWNCRHIANATMRSKIEEVCRSAGYEPPIICTPEELLEATEDEE